MTRLVRGMGCVLLICAFANMSSADDTKAVMKRTVYQPKHLNAKLLAEALAKQFKGDAELTSLTEGINAILISATDPISTEIHKILDLLDRKPRLVEIEVAIFEVRVKTDEAKNAVSEKEIKELNGPLEASIAKLEAFQKEGKITTLKLVKLSGAENQKTSQKSKASTPMVNGSFESAPVFGNRGAAPPRSTNIVTYTSTGFGVTVMPQIADDGTITVDLNIEDSQVRTPEEGASFGSNSTPAAEPSSSQLQSKVSLISGRATLAEAVKSQSKTHQTQMYILVGVKLLEDAKPKQ
jgi:hypothetical protein